MRDSPAPQPRWEPPTRRQMRARRRPVIVAASAGLALMGLAALMDCALHPAPRLIWNASASAPIGLWRIHPDTAVRTGDMVLVRTPDSVRALAAARHYLPADVPLLKRVVGTDGDLICASDTLITRDAMPMAYRLRADRLGRPLPWWQGCERLRDGRLFLLNAAPDSFDSRYFGAVSTRAVIGKATPLWLR